MEEIDEKIEKNEELKENNDENKSLITFAKLNKYFLIPFLSALFNFLSDLFGKFIEDYEVPKKLEFIEPILYDLPFVSAGLFYFISYFQVNVNIKSKSDNKVHSGLDIDYEYNEALFDKKISVYKFYKFMVLLGTMNAIDNLLWALMYKSTVFNERLFELFFIPLFSKIILKENIFKHQYFSLIISLFGIIFIIIPVCLKLTIDDIIPNILNILNGINLSLFLVINKYLVEKYYLPPLKSCFMIGISSTIIYTIGFTIYSLIINDFSYFTDCFDFSQVENKLTIILYFVFYIIFETAAQLTLFLSLFYFSPTLIMVTDMISPLLSFIVNTIIYEEKLFSIILYKIGYLIAFFSSLIYNELIILNCFGFNKNTKKYANKREYKELEEIKKT